MEPPIRTVGEFLRAVRRSRRLSQEQVASLAGTSQPTLSAYEHDRRTPTADTLNRILAACGYELVATDGRHTIAGPPPPEAPGVPATGLGEDARALEEAERRGRLRADAPVEERVAVIDAVLSLGEAALAARRDR